MYQNSHLEDYIKNLYISLDIHCASQINKFVIADKLNIGLYPVDGASEAIFSDGRQYIFLNRNLDQHKAMEEFAHELCHVLWHAGNQSKMPPLFRELQEWKADNFMYHFCVPTFMLQELDLPRNRKRAIWEIQKKFNVTFDFAEKRLEKFTQNHAYAMLS